MPLMKLYFRFRVIKLQKVDKSEKYFYYIEKSHFKLTKTILTTIIFLQNNSINLFYPVRMLFKIPDGF